MEQHWAGSGLRPGAEDGASDSADPMETGEMTDDAEAIGVPGISQTFDRPAEARAPEPGNWPASHPATGEPRVDDVLRTLASLADLPVSEHPPVFERIHGRLVEVLGELRSGPDTAGPSVAGPGVAGPGGAGPGRRTG